MQVSTSFTPKKMEVQQKKNFFEDSQLFPSSFHHSSKVDETQLLNSLTENIYLTPSPKAKRIDKSPLKRSYSPSPKTVVNMQKNEDLSPKHNYSSPFTNPTSIEVSLLSSSSSSPPLISKKSTSNNAINALIKSVFRDNKASLITQSNNLSTTQEFDRSTASRLLHICCEFDSVDSAAALLNGEVCGVIPLINEVDSATGYAPLHTAAENHSQRCIELILRKRGRTDLKTRKPCNGNGNGNGIGCDGDTGENKVSRYMIPLELSLRSVRMDIKWGPDEPLDDLLLILTQKDLGAISVLSEKTNEVGEVAYSIAMEGQVAALAALLMVAADKVTGSILEIRNHSELSAEKTTVYNCVIREAISISNLNQDKPKGVDIDRNIYHGVGPKERRALLLREIELLHFFGASHTNSSCTGKKVVPPLILACKAGDKAVMKLLLKTNIDVNEVDAESYSALHWCLKASKVSNPEQIRTLILLLKHGAKLRQKDKWGLNAVHIAARNGNLEALEILLSRDPDSVHLITTMKETPLFHAAKNDHVESAQLLLRFGASTEIHNLRRERPIELANSQQMRAALSRTSVVITNRNSQRKYTVENDVVVSAREVLPKEICSSSESVNSSSDGDICKYFTSATGCVRGSDCFYKHGEEEHCNKKSRSRIVHSLALQEFKRKIFVGGLPANLDSESLACIIKDKFGPVVEAKVLEMDIDGQILSRGFGFVTFKDEKSVADALEAHFTDIWGKKVEMKTAVPRCLLSPDHSEDESALVESPKEADQEVMQPKISQLNCQESGRIEKSAGDNKHEPISWVHQLTKAQPEESVDARNDQKRPSSVRDMPRWFTILKKWLPNFLRKMSKNINDGEYYSLSSLKTDFKALFGLDLDHASLGFPKLSDFVKAHPGLCLTKFINTGGVVANHMILLPPKVSRPPPLIISKTDFPALGPKTPVGEHVDHHGTKSDSQKLLVHPLPSDCKDAADLAKIESDKDTHSSSSSTKIPDATVPNTFVGETVANVKDKSAGKVPAAVTNPRFLQFLAPDPIFLARTWRGNGGFKAAPDEHFRPKHLVLEQLAQNKKEVFYLRSIKFYDDYEASLKQGTCFGCGDNRLVWANYPCEHLLWCSDCKFKAMKTAEVGTPSHKCVVCDHKVDKIDLIRWSKLQHQSYDEMEFPPIYAACLRSQKLHV